MEHCKQCAGMMYVTPAGLFCVVCGRLEIRRPDGSKDVRPGYGRYLLIDDTGWKEGRFSEPVSRSDALETIQDAFPASSILYLSIANPLGGIEVVVDGIPRKEVIV